MEPDEHDIDTFVRLDYYVNRLETSRRALTRDERRDLALLLRRYRKERFGSALESRERAAGLSEINP